MEQRVWGRLWWQARGSKCFGADREDEGLAACFGPGNCSCWILPAASPLCAGTAGLQKATEAHQALVGGLACFAPSGKARRNGLRRGADIVGDMGENAVASISGI